MENTKRTIKDLRERQIGGITNWHQWLEHFEANDKLQFLESLVYCGLSIPLEKGAYEEPEYSSADRFATYLQIADGWQSPLNLGETGEHHNAYLVGYTSEGIQIKCSTSKLRQRIARKAFDALCSSLFKMKVRDAYDDDRGPSYEWEETVLSETLLEALRKFFKVKGSKGIRWGELSNLGTYPPDQSQVEKTAADFLLRLAECIWNWQPGQRKLGGEGYAEALEKRMKAAKPWAIEILNALKKLSVLEEGILELDKACLAKLKEIALRTELRPSSRRGIYGDYRQVKSLDEARFMDSPAAWLISKHELAVRESKRLDELRKAQEEHVRSAQKIKQLATVGTKD